MQIVTERFAESKFEQLLNFAERLDFLDIQILRKFYMAEQFPGSTPHCFPLLYKEMRDNHRLKIGKEAFRKRLNNLVRMGFIGKIKRSNPTHYVPIKEKEKVIRGIITKFFAIQGLAKFM